MESSIKVQQRRRRPDGTTEFQKVMVDRECGPCKRDYPIGFRIKPIDEQIARLREFFPAAKRFNPKCAEGELPPGAEGFIAFPRMEQISPNYFNARRRMIDRLRSAHWPLLHEWGQDDFLQHQIQIRPVEAMQERFSALEDLQRGNDIMIVPAQLGRLHRGRSARLVRATLGDLEAGFSIIMAAAFLLTHPERFRYYDDLSLGCIAEEWDRPSSFYTFNHVPSFSFASYREYDPRIKHSWWHESLCFGPVDDDAHDFAGSATWFLRK